MSETNESKPLNPPVALKKTVQVVITKEIEIEFPAGFFNEMTEDEYLAAFRKDLWHVDSMDDVFFYAARMAAYYDDNAEYDGLGQLGPHYSTYPRVPDVKYREIYDESEEEFVNG